MKKITALLSICVASPVLAQQVRYECDAFPEETGWEHVERLFPCERWIQNGQLFQECEIVHPDPPRYGEDDVYLHDLSMFAGAPQWYIEWRVQSDALESEIAAVGGAFLVPANNSGMFYHFTVVGDRVRYMHPLTPKVTVEIAPGIPHDYRLDVYSSFWHEWSVDGIVRAAYVPYRTFPTEDSFLGFGGRANVQKTLQGWDFIRFAVPESSGVDCDAVERFRAKCRNGRITGKIVTTLEPGTELLVTNNGDHQTAVVKRSGKAKAKYPDQSGEHTLLLLDCPAISQEVPCGP